MTRPRILFGEHATQAPAIEQGIDRNRFDVSFAALDTADLFAFDLVVPLRLEEFDAARRANADGRRRVVLPDPELVELCDDKWLFNRRLMELGFGNAIPALLPDPPTEYPYIRKGRRGDFGKGCHVVHGPGEDIAIPHSFCQRAVAGDEEDVLHLLRVDGRIVYTLSYRYDMGAPLTVRGAVDRPVTIGPVDPAPAMATCVAILDALGFEGTCCFNYKLEGGALRILELNPRFGGSLVGDVNGYVAAHLAALG
ncbi:MAG TPA: hypothetical protein VF695_11985 [Sphingomonas sp.]